MCKLMDERIERERVVVQKETTNNLMNLVQKLISLGRIEDIERITTDSIYREQLIKEFSLI